MQNRWDRASDRPPPIWQVFVVCDASARARLSLHAAGLQPYLPARCRGPRFNPFRATVQIPPFHGRALPDI